MIDLSSLCPIGYGLQRPECVLAHVSGLLFVPDWSGNGGVCVIDTRGVTHHISVKKPYQLRPNGIALEANGSFLLAHLGDTEGGVFRLHADGSVQPVVRTADGAPLPPTNYVVHDKQGRLWITVSTRVQPRADDYRSSAASGFIALAEPGQSDARIVADGLGYTNECVVDLDKGHVFVNETFGRRLTRFTIDAGHLHSSTVIARFGAGTYPDGLALDENGTLWITSVVSNRVLTVSPNGEQSIIIEDSDPTHLERAEAAYQSNTMGRQHLDQYKSKRLRNISNLAFGGPERRTAYIGSLLGEQINSFAAPVSGAALPHWDVPLGPLDRYL